MKEQEFYICRHCGNIVSKIQDGRVPVVCCGEKMEKLEPNSVDAAGEKHVPVVTVDGDNVTVEVGSTHHPMTEKHLISWVYIQTEHGGQRKSLNPGDEPVIKFALADGDKAIAAFAYCNLHGLWETKL